MKAMKNLAQKSKLDLKGFSVILNKYLEKVIDKIK